MNKIQCPHCKNDDRSLIDILMHGWLYCVVCGKNWKEDEREMKEMKEKK